MVCARPVNAPRARMITGPSPYRSKAIDVPSAEFIWPVVGPLMVRILSCRPLGPSIGWSRESVGLLQAQRLPVVAIEIGEPALIPAVALLRGTCRATASCQGLLDEVIDLISALNAKNHDHLRASSR